MPRVPADGVSLAVHEWPGPGPAVVCIHGLTANHVCWLSMADILAPRHRLIGYDLRGRGESDKPATGYSLDQHGRDLLALLNHFGLKKAILMDGGIDVRAEIIDSLGPAIGRLGVEFPSLDAFLGMMRGLPMFAGRWNDHLARHYTYDVEPRPGGGV